MKCDHFRDKSKSGFYVCFDFFTEHTNSGCLVLQEQPWEVISPLGQRRLGILQ